MTPSTGFITHTVCRLALFGLALWMGFELGNAIRNMELPAQRSIESRATAIEEALS